MLGILLAAGHSRRFGPQDKLVAPLPDGRPIALAAATHLRQAVPSCTAIIRPEQPSLRALLETAGLEVIESAPDKASMADNLAAAARHARLHQAAHDGIIVALADMPLIRPDTIAMVAAAIESGARLAAPTFQGQRGHPVGFASEFLDALGALQGDEGARSILTAHRQALLLLPCDDPGILMDIDTPADIPS